MHSSPPYCKQPAPASRLLTQFACSLLPSTNERPGPVTIGENRPLFKPWFYCSFVDLIFYYKYQFRIRSLFVYWILLLLRFCTALVKMKLLKDRVFVSLSRYFLHPIICNFGKKHSRRLSETSRAETINPTWIIIKEVYSLTAYYDPPEWSNNRKGRLQWKSRGILFAIKLISHLGISLTSLMDRRRVRHKTVHFDV